MTTSPSSTALATFPLTSPAFRGGETIPARYTCDGEDLSPPLHWTGPPPRTVAFALIADDPDAPRGTFTHWVLYDVPGGTTSLPEGIPAGGTVRSLGGAKQGRADFGGQPGYRGPCPPPGSAHHYHFRLHALDAPLALPPGASRSEVETAMRGHELGHGELVGLYARKR